MKSERRQNVGGGNTSSLNCKRKEEAKAFISAWEAIQTVREVNLGLLNSEILFLQKHLSRQKPCVIGANRDT